MARAVLEERLIGGVAAIVLLTFIVLAVVVFVGMAAAVANAWRRRRAERRYDFGPRASRLWMELDAYLDETVAEDPDLWDRFGRGGNWDVTTGPTTGLDRLRQAIRDEQQNGHDQ